MARWVDVETAAEACGVTFGTITRWLYSGLIEVRRQPSLQVDLDTAPQPTQIDRDEEARTAELMANRVPFSAAQISELRRFIRA